MTNLLRIIKVCPEKKAEAVGSQMLTTLHLQTLTEQNFRFFFLNVDIG